MATCKDCLHFKACANMLRAMGYTVDGDGLDADKRCEDFAPTAEYKKVVHGRWVWKPIDERTHRLTCSVCANEEGAWESYKYCHNCGAMMDGGDEHG